MMTVTRAAFYPTIRLDFERQNMTGSMSEKKKPTTRFVSMEPPAIKVRKPSTEKEIGGRKKGLEPTRYGDWEFKGRCIDF